MQFARHDHDFWLGRVHWGDSTHARPGSDVQSYAKTRRRRLLKLSEALLCAGRA